MAISFDKAFGIHPQGMLVRSKRAEVIASNIANADTPGYKAQGMDFKAAMTQAAKNQQMSMTRTNEKHFNTNMALNDGVEYRVPNQPDTGDGNTVDIQMERNLYLQNSLEYQASVQFMNSKVKGLKKAITGGQ
ncbi:flagellar basal body rod protein FlgB [Thalassotalea sp. LPB0316]|uniref:flagellar basal body rod protein FlgB n=1 Tax=Thalassotalea sp. LPB0316 TaxID=2769490 RepID=UPI0018686441|nr:flagellar basal body rod protein FlgB [Thalassotalea sp. LPB0316]QOL27061.1 flagellar basal body rod protein FlgB [Thalassotalea sp. LPB0316]